MVLTHSCVSTSGIKALPNANPSMSQVFPTELQGLAAGEHLTISKIVLLPIFGEPFPIKRGFSQPHPWILRGLSPFLHLPVPL